MNASPSERKLYPLSAAPPYPTAEQVHSFLQKSKITDTELALEHVEMLLNVLVYDRLVERLPALGASLWNTSREQEDSNTDANGLPKKSRKRAKVESSDEDASAETDEELLPKRKKRKSTALSDKEENTSSKRKSKKRARGDSDSSEHSDTETRQRKRKRQSGVESSDEQSSSRVRKGKEEDSLDLGDMQLSTANVYRALYPMRMSIGIGWTQAPCSQCQQFDFCEGGSGIIMKGVTDLEEGPVNPRNCVYYADWLQHDLEDPI